MMMLEREPVERAAWLVNLWLDADTGNIELWVGWPFYLINWFIIASVLFLFGEDALPPKSNWAYKNLDLGTEIWYSMLSHDTQISLLFYGEEGKFKPDNFYGENLRDF